MKLRKLIRATATVVLGTAALGAAGAGGWHWWTVSRFVESTDDAYLQADYTTIAPKVSGYIATVLVADNQRVHAGQILARIDARDFKVALQQASAKADIARDALLSLGEQISLQQAVLKQIHADIDATVATRNFARDDYRRYRVLARTDYVAKQKLQQAETRLYQESARLQHNRAALVAGERRIGVLEAERAKASDQLNETLAAEHQARLNLSYTTIIAPLAGTVGERKLRVGQYVQAGTPLMAVVPLDRVYVMANFKETQLTHVRPGQAATIEVDTFPDVIIKGHVDSLSPASGLEFALLPPDNATGNFTKVVQRIPVKIVLDAGNPLQGLLRPGMSVEPSIDTQPVTVAVGGGHGSPRKLAAGNVATSD